MNRIDKLFHEKKSNILTIYYTAGFPQKDATVPILETLARNGVDLVEIGMPFSDPLADGETIQRSSEIALKNGMTTQLLFEQLQNIRQKVQIPLVLMGYLNPVLQFGVENFCQKCAEVGIDGLILPDLPLQEYEQEYQNLFEKYNLYPIFLITPQTSEARIKAMNLKNPLQIGFGISDAESFQKACQYAQGAIIGSAFIKYIQERNDTSEATAEFVKNILQKSLVQK
jgi:tryptophan synthase alpha chain